MRLRIVLLLLGAMAVPAVAQGKGQPYVDAELGIAFVPPDGWDYVPPPKDMKYGDWMPDTKVKIVGQWATDKTDADGRRQGLDLLEITDAADLDGMITRYTDDRNARQGTKWTEKSRQDFVLPAGRQRGRLIVAEIHQGYAYIVGFITNGKRHFALQFLTGAARTDKKRVDEWLKTVLTAKFLSDKEIADLRKRGPALPPGWQLHKTENYDIQYNCDKPFAITIGRHLEAILLEYRKFFPLESFGGEPVTVEGQEDRPPAQKTTLDRMTVKLFGDHDTFQKYAGSNGVGGAAAYFSPGQNELVGYKTVSQGKKLSIHIFYHEAMHQYLHALFGERVRIPIWLNEGMAEYFFGGEFSDATGRFSIGLNKERIDTIRQACRDGSYVPLDKLFKFTQAQYYANAGLCYAQGWSVAYFLWTTKDAKYQGVIENFMKTLRSTQDPDKAFNETFGKLDLQQLEADWKDAVVNKF
ncbi:MAG: DUF1570 domain-containing protein [Candidatus Brocadiae bacterium]|nr:DUF1570 domain-containing protein [Candidatus Brocadiia bacterium]